MKKNDVKAVAFDVISSAMGEWIIDKVNHSVGVYFIDGVLALSEKLMEEMEGAE